LSNVGVPEFNKDSFEKMYQNDETLQNMLKYDPEGITIYSDDTEKLGSSRKKSKNTVSSMAKRAVDLTDL
jgi:hypothetical protein